MRVLSFGGGVQSVTLFYLAKNGEIEPFDLIVFADTGYERKATYEYIARIRKGSPFEFVVVRSQKVKVLDDWGGVGIPAYTTRVVKDLPEWVEQIASGDVVEDLSHMGRLKRQCTYDWKISPVRAFIRDRLEALGNDTADLALGISEDEALRVKPSGVKYIQHIYPLLEELPSRWTRYDCIKYLDSIGAPIPPRSACVFCPFQADHEWASLSPEDREVAIQVDELIRDAPLAQGLSCVCPPVGYAVGTSLPTVGRRAVHLPKRTLR